MAMSVDWAEFGKFVSSVGVPTAVLILFVGPIIWTLATTIKEYGPKLAKAHTDFMESASRINERNAETLERLEDMIAEKHLDHLKAHRAISHASSAALDLLSNRPDDARKKLNQIDEILKVDK